MNGIDKMIEIGSKEMMTREEISKEFQIVREEFFQKKGEFERAIDDFEKGMHNCKIVFEELANKARKNGDIEQLEQINRYFYYSSFTNQSSSMRRMIDIRV